MSAQFADFISKFPIVSMPVTLGEESHHVFSSENDPLPLNLIETFIYPLESEPIDEEFTEYVPCFALEGTQNFVGVVWWKASLLKYEYLLATFTTSGELISKKVIAGTKMTNEKISHTIALINEDWEIVMAEGSSADGNLLFDPGSTRTRHLEILVNGDIVKG
jgi:hypothetical protein